MIHIIYLSAIVYLLIGFVCSLNALDSRDLFDDRIKVRSGIACLIVCFIWPIAVAVALFVMAWLHVSTSRKKQRGIKIKKK
jgi:hypothetical protein